jgi:hypothetical protein
VELLLAIRVITISKASLGKLKQANELLEMPA